MHMRGRGDFNTLSCKLLCLFCTDLLSCIILSIVYCVRLVNLFLNSERLMMMMRRCSCCEESFIISGNWGSTWSYKCSRTGLWGDILACCSLDTWLISD